VLECSFFNALVPSLVLPLVLLAIPEYKQWDVLVGHIPRSEAIISLLCISLVFAKHLDRQNKFFIVSQGSTMFFAIIDSNMKIVAGIGTLVFFGQKAYWTNIAGFLCIFVSLAIACYEKKVKFDAEQAMKDEKTNKVLNLSNNPLMVELPGMLEVGFKSIHHHSSGKSESYDDSDEEVPLPSVGGAAHRTSTTVEAGGYETVKKSESCESP
jgi:hypothetical protein